jgi:DNA replication protein DnaC
MIKTSIMNNQATLEKIKNLRLFGIQHAFQTILETAHGERMTNDEFLGYLIEAEWIERFNRKTQRLLKNAKFRYGATIEQIQYSANRNLDKNTIVRLAGCKFIKQAENIIITGATGTGKSFLASALGNQACIKGFKVLYFNTAKLIAKLKIAKAEGAYLKELAKIEKHDLVIFDDFALHPIDRQSALILLDMVEDRNTSAATIIASQIPIQNWHELIAEKTLADAILDRLVHNAHRVELKGESMRKKIKIAEN